MFVLIVVEGSTIVIIVAIIIISSIVIIFKCSTFSAFNMVYSAMFFFLKDFIKW